MRTFSGHVISECAKLHHPTQICCAQRRLGQSPVSRPCAAAAPRLASASAARRTCQRSTRVRSFRVWLKKVGGLIFSKGEMILLAAWCFCAGGKTLLQEDDLERVPETGVAAGCCTLVLTIISFFSIIILFPFSLLYVIKVCNEPLSLSHTHLSLSLTHTHTPLSLSLSHTHTHTHTYRWFHSMRGQ